MIGASKILTVSYGTFSCTLEGFDDPFNTMRAIAEYFRDLAAEDRYFGAEPPTPDAAMLLKIAEREVQRRVEAKINENGVVLRTGEAMQAPTFAPEPQPQSADFVAQPIAERTSVPTPLPVPMPDGVAAKLLRIRAAVANAELAESRAEAAPTVAPAPPLPAAADPILADYSEDQHADEIMASATTTATFAPDAFAGDLDDAEIWEQPDLPPVIQALVADEPAADAVYGRDDMSAITATSQDAEQDAEIDLAALMDQQANDDPVEAPAADDLPTAEDDGLLASLIANTNDSLTADMAETALSEPEPDFESAELATETNPEDYAISEDELADLRALDGDAPEADATLAIETPTSADFDYDEDYADIPEPSNITPSDPLLHAAFDDEPLVLETAFDPVIEEIDNVYGPEPTPTPALSEKAQRARARVIKVRRADVTEDVRGDPTEAESEVAAMLAADAEAEADLRRELRALQQQSAAAMQPQTDTDEDDAGAEDDAHPRLDPAGEAAVSRLIEQTNEAMAVPENRRRLSAIAHLKAAVAATVADRFAKGGTGPKEAETKRLDPYREDLARVVRPQHPTGTDDAPATPRPAPLVLVSAQRIDRPRAMPGDNPPTLSAVPNTPVRPRRVTSAVLAVEPAPEVEDDDEDIDAANIFSDARGFAEFSERLGANSLAEILEAAAAYSVCIEGRPYFSRPQLMSQIGALSADSEYSREDGLRTFGALLREGRIQKIKRGQFVLTESSRYLAEARTLAG